ncbi:MAG: DUF4244 domain-containing protein [Actinomycetota bacterium]
MKNSLNEQSGMINLCGEGEDFFQDAGMTTAEYAIGTIAACGFAALLVTILRSSTVKNALLEIITKALALGS